MAVGDAYVFPGFFPPVLKLFFPKPPTTFLTCYGRGERQKYATQAGPVVKQIRIRQKPENNSQQNSFTDKL